MNVSKYDKSKNYNDLLRVHNVAQYTNSFQFFNYQYDFFEISSAVNYSAVIFVLIHFVP